MITPVADADPATLAAFDTIIDVRSPAEFAEDHAPGALNLPVLNDEERARIGTIYVQDDPFRARRLGAALVARNIARHLEGPLAGRGGAWRPLIYCWRGGQRSNAMATVLTQVGWRVSLLQGGYKTYRRGVVRRLYEGGASLPPVVLLSGGTGVGKTELLPRLRTLGVQAIDLEGLANHRGSLLGGVGPQPSQKLFESRLAADLALLDPARPLVLEAESSRIGALTLPPTLWAAMSAAPAVAVQAPLEARVARLVGLYGEAAEADFPDLLDRLPRHIAKAEIEMLKARLADGDLQAVAGALIAQHYDPSYARSLREGGHAVLETVSTEDGSKAALDEAAKAIVGRLSTSPG